MKRILLSLVLGVLFFTQAFSQSIPNAGFESWTTAGAYEDPNNFVTFNMLSSFGLPVTVTKSAVAHSGSFAVRMETMVSALTGDTVPGLVQSGTGDFLNVVFPSPYSARPTRLQFYYKGGPAANDTSGVFAVLTKWDAVAGSKINVGAAELSIIAEAGAYTFADIAFNYATNDIPDSILFIATSSASSVNIPGSYLLLDDVSFSMSSAGLFETPSYASSVYPNPVKDDFKITLEGVEATSIIILDLSGRKIDEIELGNIHSSIGVKHISTGSYLYQLKNNQGIVSAGKFSINR